MIFGVSKAIIASLILILSYIVLFSEKLNRAVTVMLGASAMILLGVLSYTQAIEGVDFNTIALLIGMMIMVGIMEKSGAFQFAAVKSAKIVNASPRGMLAVLGIVTAVLSAFLDNVTTVILVIIMDCIMTFMGSTSNDSVFNAWVTDVTNPSNRPKVETVFAALPIVAMGVVMGVGSLAQTGAISYKVFFLSLGAFVMLCGVLGLFTLQDPEFTEVKETNSSYWSDLFYGFRPSVIKENAGLYLTLAASCLYSIAVQVFFPYMLIYVQYVVMPESEGINLMAASSLIPIIIAVIVLVAGIVLLMMLANKKKALAYVLGTVCFIIGLTGLGFAKGLVQVALAAAPTLIGYAVLMIQLAASVRDFTPKGKSGLFQGIRMIFNVLLPMVIGPKLGEIASVNSNTTYLDEYGVAQICPTSDMFIYAAVVTVLVLIPLVVLIKKGFLKNNAEVSE